MEIEKRTMNWMPRQSQWNELQETRAKRKEMMESMAGASETLNAAFATTRDNLSMGMSEITAKVAAARVEAEGKAKLSKSA